MNILIRNFLVFSLVLLQFFAPLVHAHVDEHYSNAEEGIHLPGFESHDANLNAPVLKAIHCAFSSNNLVVSVNTGFKVKQDKNQSHGDDVKFIHQPFFVFNLTLEATDINFSPQLAKLVSPFAHTPYGSRAPPQL